MPASTRHHRALAVFVHCLGILAAVPALPSAAPEAAAAPRPPAATPQPTAAAPPPPAATPAPAGTRPPVAMVARVTEPTPPSAPPAMAPPTRAPASAPPQQVTVAVATESSPAPRYRIQVRNVSNSPLETTVRQELPPGSSTTAISGGGRSTPAGGSATEVTWRLRLPAHSTTTLGTALAATAPGQPLTAPTCAFTSDGSRPYDCATATWQAAAAPAAEVTEAPPWRRYPVLLGGLAVLLLISAALVWVWRRRRGRRVTAAALSTGGGAEGGRGTVYPRPAAPSPVRRRRTPPVWMLVGAAVVVLAAVVGTAGWTATRQVAAIDTQKQPTSGAWVGTGVNGSLGVPLRESAFEFTVYRMTCGAPGTAGKADGGGAAPANGRRCEATVGVRNVTGDHQPWHSELQRAYLPGGRWVSTDESATRTANLGRDVFADPMAAGTRMVLPLVFTVDGRDPPQQLELRSGVFSAGVRVQMP
ncbi:hypothetical protein AB0J94_02335 [Micromonospora noduli]|uniref:hypothetical protein n=1 Tax=Micromonospora noduli TaxID=709876 RepID=UPI000DC02E77|nr:hypothetical protein [Micromonospora noduli]RAO18410.1 Calphotin [Micromonospora noduli]RAO26993.1 Calphotin [Micromonospora noduli]RAO30968.1 Calphotin [Micromonospora noduli]